MSCSLGSISGSVYAGCDRGVAHCVRVASIFIVT